VIVLNEPEAADKRTGQRMGQQEEAKREEATTEASSDNTL